ncbi:MAG TPA: membrane-bound PQQ-dependent dehydrogenase, glucose/quinate/shikimate family [Candidatus Binatia bacterium]|nr:membrane-bound PQQ-dependent dehydrogenase, glucose/quinate/shikimate family [Candidatus Binatia bacterium]
MLRDWRKPATRADWAVAALGFVIAIVGAILAIGGAILISVGGSWFYFIAGLLLIVSGMALAQRKLIGAWLYFAAFVVTALWAFWEVGLAGWPLVPRLVGPLVLLLLVIVALPTLDTGRGSRFRLYGLGVFGVLVLALGIGVSQANRAAPPGAMPEAFATAMADPSLMPVGTDWPAYGATYNAQRYSPLNQINRDNVDQLERAWTFRTGDMPEERWGAETTPLKIGDMMYLCTGRSALIAIDAASGEERWRYDPQVADEDIPYTAACRGVAYYARPGADPASACGTRIISGTLDARLIAVDARTGAPCADFGAGGAVDITTGMGEVLPGMVSITSPPVIARGVVVTGHQVLDGQYANAPSGVIQGYDAVTGELRWAWDMEHPERTGLPPEGETYTRGTPNMWTMATADEALGLVYLPLGNAAADYWSSHRSDAENRHSTALVALNAQTGREAWTFQTVHMDVWDYDLGSQPTLVDFPSASGVVPAVILASKQGEIYVLDRRTGAPLHDIEERPVPGGGLEPQLRARTQPFSRFHTLRRPDLTERDMWGMSLIDQMVCRIQFRQATYNGIYTPPTTATRWIQYPGYNGGSDWGGIAVDPRRGVIIANYSDMPNYNRLVPRDEANRLGWAPRDQARGGDMGSGAEGAGDPQWGVPFAIDVNAGWRMPSTGLLCKEPPYGGIRAIDLRTGRTIWDRPFGTARRNGPWGIPSMLPLNIGTPNNGGAAITAGGLIFIAAATDNLFRAIDIQTGETVWQDVLPAGGQANPMVYEANGRQYVVVMAGGHHFMETPAGDYVIAYALPSRS